MAAVKVDANMEPAGHTCIGSPLGLHAVLDPVLVLLPDSPRATEFALPGPPAGQLEAEAGLQAQQAQREPLVSAAFTPPSLPLSPSADSAEAQAVLAFLADSDAEADAAAGADTPCVELQQPPSCPMLATTVHVKRVPGDGHCFWWCVEAALGETRSQLRERIRSVLDRIFDAGTLTRLGLWGYGLSKESSAADVARAKRVYMCSSAFTRYLNGGTAEMLLLCYAFGGSLTFLSISASSIGEAAVLTKSPFHPVTAATRQVTLHHCAFSGEGSSANHWNLLQYRQADPASRAAEDSPLLPFWPHSYGETEANYTERLRILQREADEETQRKVERTPARPTVATRRSSSCCARRPEGRRVAPDLRRDCQRRASCTPPPHALSGRLQ